ncbi:MAG: tetratricopeptide repeat protein [Deltaproteobacteria bacterium]|nr:tetratricopeptide repeat protein [Deltaproteobacteria bacterium]
MHKMNFLNGKAFTAAAALAAVVALAAGPIGCSKEQKQAETKQRQPAQSASAAKEHFDKGVQLTMKGQTDDAIKEFEATLQIDPKSPEAHNNLGFAYYDKGDADKAIEHQKKALEGDPNLANAYYGLAMALEKKGDKEGAVANWKEFMKLAQPHSKWWMQAQTHIKNLEGKAPAKAAPPAQHKK